MHAWILKWMFNLGRPQAEQLLQKSPSSIIRLWICCQPFQIEFLLVYEMQSHIGTRQSRGHSLPDDLSRAFSLVYSEHHVADCQHLCIYSDLWKHHASFDVFILISENTMQFWTCLFWSPKTPCNFVCANNTLEWNLQDIRPLTHWGLVDIKRLSQW